MKRNMGPTIKSVRQKRGYTAKAMYDRLMSRANYARFEDGQIDTSADNLYELTKRLNISMPEWTRIYNQALGRDAGGKTTLRVNRLLNQGWTEQDPAPLREAAQLCYELHERYHYPNELLSGLTADALATYLDNEGDNTKPNSYLDQIIDYLNQMDTWYANDVGLLSNVLQVLNVDTLMAMVTRYLFMVRNNPLLGEGSAFLPTQQEVIQQSFATPIREQNFEAFTQLLDYFNAMPMSERYFHPTLMRQVYNGFAEAVKSHDPAVFEQAAAAVTTVVKEAEAPSDAHELHSQVEAMRAWLSA